MSKNRYLQIYHHLLERLESGALAVGDYLPTLAELCAEYDVSHVTALRAFRKLADEGVIERSPGQGYRVAPQALMRRRWLCFGALFRGISFIRHDQYFNSIMSSVQSASALNGYGLAWASGLPDRLNRLQGVGDELIVNEALSMASSVDGFFFDARISDCVVSEIIRQSGKRGVIVDRPSGLSNVPAVYPDFQPALDKLYAALIRLGYQHFVFCDNDFDVWGMQSVRMGFHRFIKEYHLDWSSYHIFHKVQQISYEETFANFYKYWKDHCSDKTVFLTMEDGYAREMQKFFAGKGAEAQKDYGLVGLYGLDGAYVHPEMTTLQVDTRQLGSKAVKALLDGESLDTGVGNVELIFGETI